MKESQAANLIECDTQLIWLAKMNNLDDLEGKMNQFIQDFHFKKTDTQTGRPPPDNSKLWFSTPKPSTDFSNLTPLLWKIYDQILQLQRRENMNPKKKEAD